MTSLQDFDPQATALIVIDMQRDFCSPGGYAHQAGLDIARMQAAVGQVKAC
jgi:biuret amidohydrolase